jgi:hypothetical protein
MCYHNRKLFHSEFSPLEFSYAVQQIERCPDGDVTIELMPSDGPQSITFVPRDSKGHRLVQTNYLGRTPFGGNYTAGWRCDICSTGGTSEPRWCCMQCTYDLCSSCYETQLQRQPKPEGLSNAAALPTKTLVSSCELEAPIKFALNASSQVSMRGRRHVHCWVSHSFSDDTQGLLRLVCQFLRLALTLTDSASSTVQQLRDACWKDARREFVRCEVRNSHSQQGRSQDSADP